MQLGGIIIILGVWRCKTPCQLMEGSGTHAVRRDHQYLRVLICQWVYKEVVTMQVGGIISMLGVWICMTL